jgi:hypothetical protein
MGISASSITPEASSILEIRSTSKGILLPRLTTTERNNISSAATGLIIYNTSTNKFNYYNGAGWVEMVSGSGSGVTSVTGTTNRISVGGTATDPVIDISASYVGQASITTLGTIATGTWQGSVISAVYGGTGQSTYAVGDLLYAGSSSTLSKLNGVATGNALISGGTGTAPSWGKIGLTTHVSGILPIANGGTNSTATPTSGGVAYGDGSSIQYTAAGTSGQVLKSAGSSAPIWADAGTMMFSGASNNTAVNNTTLYFPLNEGGVAGAATDVQAGLRNLVSRAGNVKNLYIKLSAALAGGKTGTVTLMKNGVATALAVTLSVGPVDFNDLTDIVSVSPGDELGIKVVTTGNVKFSWAADFVFQ